MEAFGGPREVDEESQSPVGTVFGETPAFVDELVKVRPSTGRVTCARDRKGAAKAKAKWSTSGYIEP